MTDILWKSKEAISNGLTSAMIVNTCTIEINPKRIQCTEYKGTTCM